MRYKFEELKVGESLFIPGQGLNGSAYTCAMRAQKRHNMKLTGKLEEGGVRITCVIASTSRVKTGYDRDVEMISAMIDWGSFPSVVTTDEAVVICRKALPELPEGRSGGILVGKMLVDTGKYDREKVYKKGKQVRLYYRKGMKT